MGVAWNAFWPKEVSILKQDIFACHIFSWGSIPKRYRKRPCCGHFVAKHPDIEWRAPPDPFWYGSPLPWRYEFWYAQSSSRHSLKCALSNLIVSNEAYIVINVKWECKYGVLSKYKLIYNKKRCYRYNSIGPYFHWREKGKQTKRSTSTL